MVSTRSQTRETRKRDLAAFQDDPEAILRETRRVARQNRSPNTEPTRPRKRKVTGGPRRKNKRQKKEVPQDTTENQPEDEPKTVPAHEPETEPNRAPELPPSDVQDDKPTGMPADQPVPEPNEASQGAPNEVPAGAPEELTEEVPAESTIDAPPDVPADVLEDVIEDVIAEVPAEVPAEVFAETPIELPADVPVEQTTDEAHGTPADVPAEPSVPGPARAPSSEPSDQSSEAPVPEPFDLPSDVPSDEPAREPSQPARRSASPLLTEQLYRELFGSSDSGSDGGRRDRTPKPLPEVHLSPSPIIDQFPRHALKSSQVTSSALLAPRDIRAPLEPGVWYYDAEGQLVRTPNTDGSAYLDEFEIEEPVLPSELSSPLSEESEDPLTDYEKLLGTYQDTDVARQTVEPENEPDSDPKAKSASPETDSIFDVPGSGLKLSGVDRHDPCEYLQSKLRYWRNKIDHSIRLESPIEEGARAWLSDSQINCAIAAVMEAVRRQGLIDYAIISSKASQSIDAGQMLSQTPFPDDLAGHRLGWFLPWHVTAHWILLHISLAGRTGELVYVQVYDSSVGIIGRRSTEEDRIKAMIRRSGWYGAEGQPTDDTLFFFMWQDSSQQASAWECGRFVIVQAWALLLGFTLRHRASWQDASQEEQAWHDADELCNLARRGLIDSATIEAFLRCHKFIRSESNIQATFERAIPFLDTGDLDDYVVQRRLGTAAGARNETMAQDQHQHQPQSQLQEESRNEDQYQLEAGDFEEHNAQAEPELDADYDSLFNEEQSLEPSLRPSDQAHVELAVEHDNEIKAEPEMAIDPELLALDQAEPEMQIDPELLAMDHAEPEMAIDPQLLAMDEAGFDIDQLPSQREVMEFVQNMDELDEDLSSER